MPGSGRRAAGLGPGLLAVAVAAALAGCANAHAVRGDEHMKRGEYDAAVEAYRRAALEEPGSRKIARHLDGAEERAAEAHYRRALDLHAAGDLGGTVAECAIAIRLSPGHEMARELHGRATARRAEVDAMVEAGRRALEGGDPLAAVERLAPALAYRAGLPEIEPLYERARRDAVAELRARARKKIQTGHVAEANADLERAGRLESGGGASVAALPRKGEGGTREAAHPGGGSGSVPGAATSLDEYARAAAEVKGLTEHLPRRRDGGGIPRPADYAMSEEEIGRLEDALRRAMAAKPPGERIPTWLAHGRICLRMAKETAALRRIAAADELAKARDPAGAWRELQAAARIDAEAQDLPEAAEALGRIRGVAGARLMEIAGRDLGDGYPSLARLRARQAREIAPDVPGTQALEARAAAAAGGPAIVLMPFQNYTGAEGLDGRFAERLLGRLARGASGPVMLFDVYRRRREAGTLPPIAGVLKGDLVRLEVQEGLDAAAAAEARVAAHGRAVEEARRRLAQAERPDAKARARAAVEEAERTLARAERERAAAVFGSRRARTPPRPGDAPVIAVIEVQFGIHDPATGRDVAAETVVRTAEGWSSQRAEVEERLLSDAVEPVAAAIEARFFDLGRAGRNAAPDPRRALDAKVAALEATKPSEAPDAAASAEVLEATGYSYVERRTVPHLLKLE